MFWTALLLGGCGSTSATSLSTDQDAGGPRIVATTGMIGDMVAELVGANATVETIMGPGVDPHLYSPSRSIAVKLRSADIVVYNGLHLEGRLGEVLESRGGSGVTIAVGETLPHDRLIDADAGTHDPHIWMNVALWSEAVGNVAEQLAAAMPDRASEIESRAAEYQSRLAALDAWAEASMKTVPADQRILITAHDAFRYFGDRYDVEVHGVQGVSTISDAAIRDINRLVDLIVTQKVPAVFFESSVNPRQVEAIVEGARSKGMTIGSDFELLSDSMGAAGTPTGNYIGMMQHNVSTIATALGGSPTDLPLQVLAPEIAATTSGKTE